MNNEAKLAATVQFVRAKHEGEATGHDWWHIDRVVKLATTIAEREGANVFLCQLAALLHDVADEKVVADKRAAQQEVTAWLERLQLREDERLHIEDIIATMSFAGGHRPPMRTLEGKVVQDADRLDAIGAIGLARTFCYSGAKGRPLHDPQRQPRLSLTEEQYRAGDDTAYMHIHEKLLTLAAKMNTTTAQQLAADRHRVMEQFVAQFEAEWRGER